MADLFKNITESDYGDKGVRLLPSRVTGDAATIQRVFDELSLDVLIPAVNVIVNTLNSLKLDFRVTSNDIKAIRVNSDNVIEVSLNGVTYIAVSDPKGSTEELKTYITDYINQINETLIETKADKNNVLEKDNTEAYTPTLEYHPATKKYVDDAVFNTGAADMTKAVYDPTGRNTDMFAYVDNKIGDINTALDNVNGEVI